MRTRTLYAVVTLLLACALACASLAPKQKATTALQGTEAALGATQDAERRLCDPDRAAVTPPVAITDCVGPAAAAIGLTSAKHRQVAAALALAFTAQARVSAALQAWRAGDPEPQGLAAVGTAAQEALTALGTLTAGVNPQVTALLQRLQGIVASVNQARAAFQGR